MKNHMRSIGIALSLVMFGVVLSIFSIGPLRSQIMEQAGLAVAQSDLQWNKVKDAAVGDSQTTGLLANGNYGFNGTTWDRLRSDPVTADLKTIDSVHAAVHKGILFTQTDYATAVAIVAPKYWRITTPNTTKRIHLAVTVDVAAAALIQVYEHPTINAAGTALTPYNNDRNSATAATATTFKDTTVTVEGTLLQAIKVGANTPQTRIGGTARPQAEWILKQNESYNIKITTDADGNTLTINMQWYEEG